MAVEQVVPKDQAGAVARQEVAADDEGLGEAIGTRLFGILQAHAPLRTIAQQPPEERQVVGRRDDEDLAQPRQHEHAERIVDHGLVVDRQELLGDGTGHGMEARARAAGEDDALHGLPLVRCSA